jgi:hypothetical protein
VNERTRNRVERVDRWARWLLSETARREILGPFIADHLAEVGVSGDLPRSFEREALQVVFGAFVEDRRRMLRGASWHHLIAATALAGVAALLAGCAPIQKIAVVIGAALGVALGSAGGEVLRFLGRAAPAAFVTTIAALVSFGLESEGRQAWLALGPVTVQPATLLLPLILLVPMRRAPRVVMTLSALALFLLGDRVAGAAMLLVWLPTPARGLALISAVLFAPLAFGDPLPLVTTSGSATVALLVSSVLLRHRAAPGATPA